MRAKLIAAMLVLLATILSGCQQYETKNWGGYDNGWTKDQRTQSKQLITVKVMPNGEVADTTTDHITNVPLSLAIAKGYQALANYNLEDAQALGYNFPLSTVWQPETYTRQIVDGHTYWIALLGFHGNNQAAYKQAGGICPGIVVVDAEDETKPAQIRLRNALGKPYQIKLHFRDANWDPNYIYRWLKDHSGLAVDNWSFDLKNTSYHRYIDDVTPEVEDGTWNVYFSASYNINQMERPRSINDWHLPVIDKVILVNASTEELKEYPVDQVPAWVDRIYSEQVVAQYLEAWGYDPNNYNRTSQRNNLVLDDNVLDAVMDKANKELVYVGVMTSPLNDNTALGVMVVPTRDVKRAKFYPCYGAMAMASRAQAVQVINDAVGWFGAHVEDLTLHHLYGRPTWEGALVKPISFSEQEHGDNTGEGDTHGSTYYATVLVAATPNINVGDVIYAPVKQHAFDKYEHYLFVRQTSNVGSMTLEEKEAEGTIGDIDRFTEEGQPMFLFSLKEPQYKGLYFRLLVESTFDRDSVDVLKAQPGDRVTFKYGDDKTSPTCFVKRFRSLSRPIWHSRAGETTQ